MEKNSVLLLASWESHVDFVWVSRSFTLGAPYSFMTAHSGGKRHKFAKSKKLAVKTACKAYFFRVQKIVIRPDSMYCAEDFTEGNSK